jgi:hypothetical protein
MSDDNDVRPLLVEIRDIVLRHEEVNRKDVEFRKRVLVALLLALAVAVAAMGYGLMLVHATIKEIKQRQEQQQPQKVARIERVFGRSLQNPSLSSDLTNEKTSRCPRMARQSHG